MELARTMNEKNPMGLRLTKEAVNMNLDAGGLEQALSLEDRNQALLVARGMLGQSEKRAGTFRVHASPDGDASIAAFMALSSAFSALPRRAGV